MENSVSVAAVGAAVVAEFGATGGAAIGAEAGEAQSRNWRSNKRRCWCRSWRPKPWPSLGRRKAAAPSGLLFGSAAGGGKRPHRLERLYEWGRKAAAPARECGKVTEEIVDDTADIDDATVEVVGDTVEVADDTVDIDDAKVGIVGEELEQVGVDNAMGVRAQ